MDNPGFVAEDNKTPSTDDENRNSLDGNGDKTHQHDTEILHSPNTQEITAIIHPAPPEITEESKKSDKIPLENGHHKGKSHHSKQSKWETAPPLTKVDSSTGENVPQTNDEKPARSNSIVNGHSVPNDKPFKKSLENESTEAEKITQELIGQQGEENTDGNVQSSDCSLSISEAETLASNKKSGWYYALLAIFFLGFLLALTLGLIFGRETSDSS